MEQNNIELFYLNKYDLAYLGELLGITKGIEFLKKDKLYTYLRWKLKNITVKDEDILDIIKQILVLYGIKNNVNYGIYLNSDNIFEIFVDHYDGLEASDLKMSIIREENSSLAMIKLMDNDAITTYSYNQENVSLVRKIKC